MFGDAKTVENVAKFVRDMQLRKISCAEANRQTDIFVKAMSVVMEIPGDWHTSLSILTSIYNLYYDGFLDQFKAMLDWKCIFKDVRSCYYQASRLVTFVHDELMRFFLTSLFHLGLLKTTMTTWPTTSLWGKLR